LFRDDNSDRGVESKIPKQQKFSQTFVEDKRCRRNLAAVINGMTVADAIRAELVDAEDGDDEEHIIQVEPNAEEENSMFFPDTSASQFKSAFSMGFNPEATPFSSSKFGESAASTISQKFGQPAGAGISQKFGGPPVPTLSRTFGEFAGASPMTKSAQPADPVPHFSSGQKPVASAEQESATVSPKQPLFSQQSTLGTEGSSTSTFSFKSPFTTPQTTVASTSPTKPFTWGNSGVNNDKPHISSTSSPPSPFTKPESPKATPNQPIFDSKSGPASQPSAFTPTSPSFPIPSLASSSAEQTNSKSHYCSHCHWTWFAHIPCR
jgi:hypothetical protein